MISLYISSATWLHKIPAGVKLAVLAIASLLVLPVGDWTLLSFACTAVIAVYFSLGKPGPARLWSLRILLPLVLGIGLFQVLVTGWESALLSIFRILFMVMLADLVTASTPMQDMMRVVLPLFAPLKFIGLKPETLALSVALVIRFIPVLAAQWAAQSDAWRARSGKRPGFKLIIPFISRALARTDQIAESIAARK
jgi:biotin transport system permease protein